jgi:hypothetical protein
MKSLKEDQELLEILAKLIRIENELGENDIEKREELQAEKEELLTQYELMLIELDRINIRFSPEEKSDVDFLQNIEIRGRDLKELRDYYSPAILDFHEHEGLLDKSKFVNNYYKLKPPYVRAGTQIPQGIKNLCHESRRCYVYGQYSASIALSRTVIEIVLKHKFNLEGDLRDIINQACEEGFIGKQSGWNAHRARILANQILHKANIANEKQARESLEHVLNFIEDIYLNKSIVEGRTGSSKHYQKGNRFADKEYLSFKSGERAL